MRTLLRRLPSARVLRFLALAVCALGPGAWLEAGGQPASDIAVVAHPDVPVDNLTLPELRRLLLGDREFWSSGVRVTLLIRAPIARERDAAVQSVCQMTEAQFRQHWIGKVFRADVPSGPKIVYSTEMALDQVSRLPGAISFVPITQVTKNVKVLKIDGRSPGQTGYKLK
jgi:ABC-type phosphate transport system substrate-binding protein